MLTLDDCISLCELTEDEVLAVAEHEHIPEVVAAEFAHYLLRTQNGEFAIKAIIRDDITHAIARCDRARERALKTLLRNFVLHHPCCEERHRQALGFSDRRAEGVGP